MNRLQNYLYVSLTGFALVTISGQPLYSQGMLEHFVDNQATQDQSKAQPDDQNPTKTFTGMIVKSGDKFVLTDVVNKTSYQLDDQQKAQDFANKTVKVTGVLDPTTGTIRVSAINPI
jgi:hypothetical protein